MCRCDFLHLIRRIAPWFLALVLFLPLFGHAQQRSEYRAFWVDTFNSNLNNHDDVVAVVDRAKAVKANTILAQVRRRGDAWYLRGDEGFVEPKPDGVSIAAGFDPLQDLIEVAHAERIEVHAYVIVGAIWNRNPDPSTGGAAPSSPNHVFNKHGGYDPATRTIVHDSNNWLTRSLIPDGTAAVSYQGHRFGAEFWIDLGHPDAAEYTHNVLMSLVRNYDIDGLHLDRIRYPELSIGGQTPATGTSIGYNSTSVARFRERFRGAGNPATGKKQWSQWRRDQVTNFVRRLYIEATDAKPLIKISAALIAFGSGPVTESQWASSEAYWRVYQDWRSWTEEGILDIAIPMVYKREHIASQETQFNQWAEWLKNHQYNRSGLVGLGNFINSIEGTIRQTRRSLAPSAQGRLAAGVAYFSMATSNDSSNSGSALVPNPYSVPPGQMTPVRTYAEFASGLTTSKSATGATLYEPIPNDGGVFRETATIPVMTWKSEPSRGHVKGFVRRADNTILDSSAVTVIDAVSGEEKVSQSDGKGFYGVVDLKPGTYYARAVLGSETLYSEYFTITAGKVTRADINSRTNPGPNDER